MIPNSVSDANIQNFQCTDNFLSQFRKNDYFHGSPVPPVSVNLPLLRGKVVSYVLMIYTPIYVGFKVRFKRGTSALA